VEDFLFSPLACAEVVMLSFSPKINLLKIDMTPGELIQERHDHEVVPPGATLFFPQMELTMISPSY
jgi:hypothetical protein